jgi:membrane-associated phospholipid phosphatase
VDRRLYLDVNRFAARTAWAHGVLAFFARPSALVILAVLLLLALARARMVGFGGTDPDQMAALVSAAIGAALAYAVSLPVVHLVGRVRPFVAMPQARLLIAGPGGFSFPNEHAVIAGGIATGLWLSRARVMAALATLCALLVAFAVVYAGTAYPGDAVGGLLLGTFVSLVFYAFAIGSLRDLTHGLARSPLKFLVGGTHHRRPVGPGPAARPELVGESGAVRILPHAQAGTVRVLQPKESGSANILPPDETGAGHGANTAQN